MKILEQCHIELEKAFDIFKMFIELPEEENETVINSEKFQIFMKGF